MRGNDGVADTPEDDLRQVNRSGDDAYDDPYDDYDLDDYDEAAYDDRDDDGDPPTSLVAVVADEQPTVVIPAVGEGPPEGRTLARALAPWVLFGLVAVILIAVTTTWASWIQGPSRVSNASPQLAVPTTQPASPTPTTEVTPTVEDVPVTEEPTTTTTRRKATAPKAPAQQQKPPPASQAAPAPPAGGSAPSAGSLADDEESGASDEPPAAGAAAANAPEGDGEESEDSEED